MGDKIGAKPQPAAESAKSLFGLIQLDKDFHPMTTIFVFDEQLPALATVAAADILLVQDASTGLKKAITVTNAIVTTTILGAAATATIGFYGVTAVNQGTMTATAVTAIGTTTISAANTNSVFGFASSTAAAALVKRVSQAQADLETLMARIDSVGLVSIAGV